MTDTTFKDPRKRPAAFGQAGVSFLSVLLGLAATGCQTATETSPASETPAVEAATVAPAPSEANAAEAKLLGTHLCSLQWISWDDFGTVTVVRGENGRLRMTGGQDAAGSSGDYLKIDGIVTPLDETSFEFEGVIRTRVSHIAGGQEVVRKGTFQFASTQGRQYWRLQQMSNPQDSVTDYVDVYF